MGGTAMQWLMLFVSGVRAGSLILVLIGRGAASQAFALICSTVALNRGRI